jgi:RecJ-like exonuclease
MGITDNFNTLDYEQECDCDRCLEEKKLVTIEATQKVLKKLKNAGIRFDGISYDRSISFLEGLRQEILTHLCLRS